MVIAVRRLFRILEPLKQIVLSCVFRPLVEFSFVLWGEEALPEDLTDIASHLENFGGSEPMPSWLIEIADMLAQYKDDAKIIASRYRECLSRLSFGCSVVEL